MAGQRSASCSGATAAGQGLGTRCAPQSGRRRCGAVLFEVILALALLVAAAAVIGGGLTAGIHSVERLRLTAHAMDLAVTVMSELQMAQAAVRPGEPQPFGPPFEDWSWEVILRPMEGAASAEGSVTLIEVVIRHKAPPFVYRLTYPLPSSTGGAMPQSAEGTGTTP